MATACAVEFCAAIPVLVVFGAVRADSWFGFVGVLPNWRPTYVGLLYCSAQVNAFGCFVIVVDEILSES